MSFWNFFALPDKNDYDKLNNKLDLILEENSKRIDKLEQSLIEKNEKLLKSAFENLSTKLEEQYLQVIDEVENISVNVNNNLVKIESKNKTLLENSKEEILNEGDKRKSEFFKEIQAIEEKLVNLIDDRSNNYLKELLGVKREVENKMNVNVNKVLKGLEQKKKMLSDLVKEENNFVLENMKEFNKEILSKHDKESAEIIAKLSSFKEKLLFIEDEKKQQLDNLISLNKNETGKIEKLEETLDIIQQLIKITWINDLMDQMEDNIYVKEKFSKSN